jgi:hypothetical protein
MTHIITNEIVYLDILQLDQAELQVKEGPFVNISAPLQTSASVKVEPNIAVKSKGLFYCNACQFSSSSSSSMAMHRRKEHVGK